jgi:AbrB family looped-hinge helix DNA binding protein
MLGNIHLHVLFRPGGVENHARQVFGMPVGEIVCSFADTSPRIAFRRHRYRAGRVLIPKALRQELHLGPGDTLQLDSSGEVLTLRPLRPKALLEKERGVWVYKEEPARASIPDLIDREREKRLRELMG